MLQSVDTNAGSDGDEFRRLKIAGRILEYSETDNLKITVESGLHFFYNVIITFFNKKFNNLSNFHYQYFFNDA